MSENDTATKTNQDSSVFGLAEETTKNLPMVIETAGDQELINRENMAVNDIQEAMQIAEKHDITDTAANLYYGAAGQNELNKVLDQLLDGIKTKEAGMAGVLAVELNDSIDMLKLEETKKQIISGPGFFAKNFAWLINLFGGIANYINYMIQMQDPIREKFDQLVKKYNNRIQTLSNNSDKLDTLVDATVKQIENLAIVIVAGEEILKKAKAKHKEMAESAMTSNDTLKLQEVRDYANQVAIFDTRFVQLKHAYVEASAVTIPRVRRSQEAIKIEIEGIVRGILFVIPKLKSSVIELVALYETKAAQKDRQALDDVESRISAHTTDILDDVVTTAKQSQGNALKRAQDLERALNEKVYFLNELTRRKSEDERELDLLRQ